MDETPVRRPCGHGWWWIEPCEIVVRKCQRCKKRYQVIVTINPECHEVPA